jgi:hypothetical protein
MKKLLIICTTISLLNVANAQTASNPGKWEENDNSHKKMTVKDVNEFESTEMGYSEHLVTFSGLPETKKPIYAVITNSTGEFIKQRKINEAENSLKVEGLPRGLYFVTVVYRQKGKRAYTLNIE